MRSQCRHSYRLTFFFDFFDDREFVYIVILSSGWVVGSGKRAGGRVAGGGPGSVGAGG